MYYVKVSGESLKDLEKGLEAKLNELKGRTSIVKSSSNEVRVVKTQEAFEEEEIIEEEMEDVPSPYTATPSKNIIIDNEVDSEGLPWDDRIHASSKAKVKDGSWREKRGAETSFINTIKAELRSRVQSATVMTTPPQPVYQAPSTPMYVVPAEAVITPVVAPAPVVVVAPPMPTMGHNGHTLDTFTKGFALIIAQLITEGKINQDYVNQLKAHFGITEIWEANAEQIKAMFDFFAENNIIQKVG